eukprot:CAMPEP_0206217212 /NCGR_PEP_ID=MMETSP0047_2-20121206/3155_1 /ASSEMBLY_ACC=CAM_ASM_000192 /TAXON_ID=195065 /ORGANISM="Chroomonas mesostigmatica_cf, Strain CCMP1168" /LENGTH=83 /DNA_ID=CAMNT_0053639653 /DNA_START=72 /DNA_END=323 /DNA_ORIENTATION=+
MGQIPHLLHAQLGVPVKSLVLTNDDGVDKVSLRDYLCGNPRQYFVANDDTVMLRAGSALRPGETVGSASTRVLSQILSRKVGA